VLQFGIFMSVTVGSLTTLLVLGGLWRPGRARIRRRLAGEFKGDSDGPPSPLYKDLDALDGDSGTKWNPTAAADGTEPGRRRVSQWRARLEDFLRQGGVPWSVRLLFCVAAGTSLVLAVLGLVFFGWIAALAGPVAVVCGLYFFLTTKRKIRQERYLTQLVGAFELMARVLRSGQSVSEAIRAAVEAFEDPLGGEFERSLHQIEHGLRPEAAYRELSQRSGILELRIFVVAMTIQRQSGGNLSEVLDRLALVVRTRMRVRQKIRALTAEGRLQSLTLIVLPILTFGVMYFLNRQHAETLLAHGKLVAATIACMGVGVLWIRNIMNFEG
jgi:tight adherence protein B